MSGLTDGGQHSPDNQEASPGGRPLRTVNEVIAALAGIATVAGLILACVVALRSDRPEGSPMPSPSAPTQQGYAEVPERSTPGREPSDSAQPPRSAEPTAGPTNPTIRPSTPSRTEAPGEARGSVQVPGGTWIEFDDAEPGLSAAGDPSSVPPSIDVEIGPDNAYPHHGRIWQTDSPSTCHTQAASNGGAGFQRQIVLADVLEAREGSTVHLCVVTGGGRFGSLTVSSAAHNTRAPYLIGYSFQGR
jgi:hypothetical protein